MPGGIPSLPGGGVEFGEHPEDALEREIAIDKQLVAAGLALPESYFYEKYARPAPVAARASL